MFIGAGSVPRLARLPTAARRNASIGLPAWAPAVGNSATFDSGGSVLTNTFRSQVTVGGAFEGSKILRAYSGTFLLPVWRDFGAIGIFGGGHANTNHNGGYGVALRQNTMTFERLWDATTWTAGETGDIEPELNSYGEKTGSSPLRVASGHSYGMNVVVGQTLWRVLKQAVKYTGGGDIEFQSAHSIDLSSPSTGPDVRAWVRETNGLGAWAGTASPSFLAHSASQGRLYYMGRTNAQNLRWFDLASKAWVTGDNASWGYPSADTDGGDPVTGKLFPVPERDLVVAAYRQSGNLVLQYIQTTASQPTVATASLGTSLALPVEGGKAVCWCPRNSRILVFGVTSNTDRCYEVTIPATLTDSWTVDSAVIGGAGAIDPVAIATRSGWSCDYHDQARCVLFLHDLKHDSSTPDTIDRVTAYRPRNT